MDTEPLLGGGETGRRSRLPLALAGAAFGALLLAGANVSGVARSAAPAELLAVPAGAMLYGGHHWGGVGSEGYGTSSWDNTGWNAHYHPRDGASMDSESMEPYTWRKGPRVNNEYVTNDGGDPTVDPGKSWEPPIMVDGQEYYKGPLQSLASVNLGAESESKMLMKGPRVVPVGMSLYGGHHWGGVGSEGYGTSSWDNTGWNAQYHPRDGASMDSESMEPYTWRKGPRVNNEYVTNDGGDPTVDPGKSWEPPIMVDGQEYYKGPLQSLAGVDLGAESESEMLMHPRGDSSEGTWVEPGNSARSVIGEQQYGAWINDALEA